MFAGRGKGREEEMMVAGERGHLAGAPFSGTEGSDPCPGGRLASERKPHFPTRRRRGKKLGDHIQGPLEGSVPTGRLLLKVRDKVPCRSYRWVRQRLKRAEKVWKGHGEECGWLSRLGRTERASTCPGGWGCTWVALAPSPLTPIGVGRTQ